MLPDTSCPAFSVVPSSDHQPMRLRQPRSVLTVDMLVRAYHVVEMARVALTLPLGFLIFLKLKNGGPWIDAIWTGASANGNGVKHLFSWVAHAVNTMLWYLAVGLLMGFGAR
ncbi:hypothetical protein AMTR_s00091p00120090 [Amborella trichopoda]|uniref:Uncharacterized protein n=1 Tax=Amborella trichopoda TaxID=13333 RepID=W1NY89_AMBTC|nr:hypothetical protein AMTR_s00091p00120090 [Amborella trichopoda]